jgi:hypothetical protein
MSLQAFTIVFYFCLATILCPIILLLSNFGKINTTYRSLLYLLILSLFCDLLSELLYHLGGPVNIGGTTYSVLHPIFFSILIYNATDRKKKLKIPLILLNLLYFPFSLSNFLFIQKINLNTYNTVVGKIIIMTLCIVYYYSLIKSLPVQRLQRFPLFWIVSAFFFTESAKLVVYSVAQYLINVFNDNLIFLWSIHNGLTIILNIILGFAVWTELKRMKTQPAT